MYTFTIEAVYQIDCDSRSEIREIIITKNNIPDAPVSYGGKGCVGDALELSVQSPEIGSSFLWFEDKEGEEIPGANTSVFLTDTLDSTKSYWVSVITNSGCVSEKVEVKAEIKSVPKPSITADGFVLRSSEAENYQWYIDGDIMEDETSQFLQSFYAGEYTVEVSEENCTEISEPYALLVSGIESTNEDKMVIYPNPVVNNLEIQIKRDQINFIDAQIEVFELNGRQVLQFELNDSFSRSVDVSSLPAGLYILKLYSQEQIFEQKFIKK